MTGSAEATVRGPYGAERMSFSGPDLARLGCGRERAPRPAGLGAGSIVLFENQSDQPLTVFPLSAEGRRVMPGTLVPAGGRAAEPVPAANPLVVTHAQGRCRAVYQPASEPAKAILR